MVVAIAVWSLELKPGTQEELVVPNDLRITNVALAAELADANGRTSVKLTYEPPKPSRDSDDEDEEEDEEDEPEDEEPITTVLCSLTPSKIEQAVVDLILEEGQNIIFEVVGKNTVYLTGNYIDQMPPPGVGDEDDYDMGDYGLDEGDSEDESDELDEEDEDAHRFEEVADEDEKEEKPAKVDSKKRPREADTMDVDAAEQKLSKSQKKKLSKKQKGEDGQAVTAGEEKQAEKPKEKKEKKEKEQKVEKPETKELAGGVQVVDHKVGTGRQAKKGDLVAMRYIGKLTNGKVFDSNTKGQPFKFRLGRGEVIKGWDVGVAGMAVGGERVLHIPAAMGYGKKGAGPDIPPNAQLNFEVKLVSIM